MTMTMAIEFDTYVDYCRLLLQQKEKKIRCNDVIEEHAIHT
jgi:hypothetical protein